jgi:hypothetical protein
MVDPDLRKFDPDLAMLEHHHLGEQDRQILPKTMYAQRYQWITGAIDMFFFKHGFLSDVEAETLFFARPYCNGHGRIAISLFRNINEKRPTEKNRH